MHRTAPLDVRAAVLARRASLASALVLLLPSPASAQVVVVPSSPPPPEIVVPAPPPPPGMVVVPSPPPVPSLPPAPPCGYGGLCVAPTCLPCTPAGPCPVCVDGSVTVEGGVVVDGVIVPSVVIGGVPAGDPPAAGSTPVSPPEVGTAAPVAPAPGTLELGYFGGTDFETASFHGAALRTTGHVEDIYFIDLVLGASGSDARPSLYELVGMVGLRIAGPVVPNLVRLFWALDVGVAARGTGETSWSALASETGVGIEIGFGDPFSVGFFSDVRLVARLPFEREPGWVGIGWSAGLAVLWF